ncbi:helix-turn-helix domain-containing protein [Flavobacterium luminosum]|uniref:Helix-turn-helix domain-containing protein n=1 Tax=Flavobacterium luminosum TaxID=2949086 RepID=A0ABT0TR41_9FLAO|nr:helix-turn-helix domain-containing protein [Flavobacterium sp. HXWNR70]MCL9809964.1 helix-turn-helix domain-containing protein [Flavobacterium sp. HXWNR70]
MQTISEEAKYTLQFINQTQRNIFLTGRAGTGKTTLLREIIKTTHKNVVVVAPTGIAALNAGGVTIHSLFQLPFAGFIPEEVAPQFSEFSQFETRKTLARHFKMSSLKKAVIRNMELLIIDEVSMLRADLLDAMNFMLQTVRKNRSPFGGIQVLFIGDLLQLPPVIRDDEWKTLRNYYHGKYFFHSHVFQNNPPLYIELTKIFRQKDDVFIALLNNLRHNYVSQEDVDLLNRYVISPSDLQKHTGYITLSTHNAKAEAINTKALADLEGTLHTYLPDVIDDFPKKIYPVEEQLQLKVGAQIMFIKNDLNPEKRFFNGKMGVIKSLSEEEILVQFPEEDKAIVVEKYEWQNIRYFVNPDTKEIEEEVMGTFVHYPIKLAWAITVHKSQGLTFDKAALDVSQVFLPGQAYVALSRLRSLDGLILLSKLQMNGISNDEDVMLYAENKVNEEILGEILHQETKKFLLDFLKNSFDWNQLLQEWRNHLQNYDQKSEKSSHYFWVKKQVDALIDIVEPARKFKIQLDQLFSRETIDYQFIEQRINAAYDYFFKVLDDMVYKVLWKLEEVKRAQKAKTLFDELTFLEEIQVKSVLRLMKAKLMIKTIVSGEVISKENLFSEETKLYKSKKITTVQNTFKEQHFSILEDEIADNRYKSKSKTQKKPKKNTVQETFELWQAQNSIKEIAVLRKLTTQTISGHIAKLIEMQAIKLHEVLPEDKIQELSEAFKGYQEESLTPLKEKYGDQFTWDELRMFKASVAPNN